MPKKEIINLPSKDFSKLKHIVPIQQLSSFAVCVINITQQNCRNFHIRRFDRFVEFGGK